ncbi:phosphoribosylaminoimidazole carboxylase [Streptococcus iniae]|uniref:Phosphoribosylaminoimidazole carboxylase n=1 Tax=Streptococcus iniae TaxID=1346 RepID=A0A1J0MWP1_STRIN|nr:hypothetical protein [Streptococcus iniae]AGM97873.1 hypothetical protein K710_0066 [Streptococcus iniae SF1]AHY14963.1 phosphoribosylaminoimidazole carboxylase [Streptococcus iniae]AHY16835.1 phosphoribosylaminoimidazole carboxylase [Streptococcus iniae]AJG25119.1 phosphoribosylaminoimidazole carboxylase [Streptococcus iniae]APD31020.1 phosphoribosylaminoimidazole carboxylase [Streptococcus iniae]
MIKIIVHAFIEDRKLGIFEVLYASEDDSLIAEKMAEYKEEFSQDYLAVYDLPLDTDLNHLSHYPSVAIGKEEFE